MKKYFALGVALVVGVTIATIAIFRPIAAEVIGGDYHKPFEWRGRKFSSFPSDHAALLVTYEIVH